MKTKRRVKVSKPFTEKINTTTHDNSHTTTERKTSQDIRETAETETAETEIENILEVAVETEIEVEANREEEVMEVRKIVMKTQEMNISSSITEILEKPRKRLS